MIFNKNDAGKGYAMSRLRNNRKKKQKIFKKTEIPASVVRHV